MLEIGSIIDGKYKILNVIGQGGMSVVYLALNERANKTWAIKEVRKDGKQDFEVVKQGLVVETDMLKKLHHPNLPSIVDVIDGDGSFLIVMDYIEGSPLSDYVKNGPLAQEDVIEWSKQLCDVLGYLHSRKPPIIYRDMKPSNVMLKPDGTVTVIDFGIAREYKEGNVADTSVLGTRGYAAPEQYGGQGQTDARTDIYTLGATMYHLVTGHSPAEYPYEMYPIRQWNPSLSSGLEEIILKCTRPRPDDRYQNCAELFYALEHYSELDESYKRKQSRKWAGFIASASVTLFAGIGAIGAHAAETKTINSTYEAYLSEADGTPAETEEEVLDVLDIYSDAIKLNPSDGQAYEKIVALCVKDGNFSQEEEVKIRSIINYSGESNKRNIESLEQNEDAYDKFAFDLGMAYFYFYKEGGSKSAASRWLAIAAEAEPTDSLGSVQIDRSKRLYKISEYYDSLGIRNKTGDFIGSYADFWKDLVVVTDGNLAEEDNEVTALVMYKELMSQIHINASNFVKAGVTIKELEEQVEKVEGAAAKISVESGSYEEELKNDIYSYIGKARSSVKEAENIGSINTVDKGVGSDDTGAAAD